MAMKHTLFLLYDILKKHSDPEHPLTEHRIVEFMNDANVFIDRNWVERNMGFLTDAGIRVEHVRGKEGGYYLAERTFTEEELRLLIDSVLASRHISKKNTQTLIRKIEGEASEYFKKQIPHVNMVDSFEKTENEELFKSIKAIDRAISSRKALHFDYMRYGTDKKLRLSSSPTVSAYQLILQNQRYYLVSYNMNVGEIRHYRVDRIKNAAVTNEPAVPLRDVPGFENGMDYRKYATQLPYMFTDKPETIVFLADIAMIDQVVDWLGTKNVTFINNAPEGMIRVRATASPSAIKFWFLQYLDHFEVLQPESLRRELLKSLEAGVKKYSL